MSSQARKAANKRNAVRSTGPLTASGKQRASRNALKHGLSTSIRHRPDISNKIEALAVAIAGANSIPRRLQAARGVAEAELELRRLQEFRLALIEVEAAKIRAATKGDRQDGGDERATQDTARAYMQALPVLAKLERYSLIGADSGLGGRSIEGPLYPELSAGDGSLSTAHGQ
jgi:hypothetical protein